MADLLWVVGTFGGCALMYWLSTRIEPHWVGRDARRILTQAQLLDARGAELGRPFEARVVVLDDGMVVVARRRMLRRRREAAWWVATKSPSPPKRREVFLLRPHDPHDDGMLALRMPAKSRAVPVFDELLARGRAATA